MTRRAPRPPSITRRRATRSARSTRAATHRRTRVAGGLLVGLAVCSAVVVLPAGETTPHEAAQTSPYVQAESLGRPSAIAVPSANRAHRRASRGGVRTVPPVRYVTKTVAVGSSFSGEASWYGMDFQGRRTASGETFNTDDLTAANKTLAFGTRLRVCRQGTCVLVRINDRGPYVGGRVLDLSRAARNALGYDGVAFVTATPVGTRTVAVRLAAHPVVRRAKHRKPRPAPRPSASPTPAPQPVLAAASRRDDAPSAVLAGALVVLAAGGLVHGRRRKVHS